MTDTFTHERPTLWERLARLAGQTTYREPVEGRSTRLGALPGDHELCVALGWARRRDDPYDIGPDIVFDMVCGGGRNTSRVVRTLANALDQGGGNRGQRIARRNRPYLQVVAADAYARLVYRQRFSKPDGMDEGDWEALTEAAYKVLATMADDAVDRAASKLRKGA